MLLCEILKYKSPLVFRKLCEEFHIKEEDLPLTPGEIGYFDAFYEMVHDSEGRYLNYAKGGRQ